MEKTKAKMKDSGIEWIGKIPEDWNIRKVKDITRLKIGWTPDTSVSSYFEGTNLWATIADLDGKYILETKNQISDEAVSATGIRKVKKGSLLYSFKLSVGKVAFAGVDLYTNEAIASFEPSNKVNLSFLYYAFLDYLLNNANENIYGAKLLNQHLINNAGITIPSLEQQSSLANFLDSKTSTIDHAIEQKRKLIDLIKEKRTAIINRAVTRGLDENVELVDSGVEWIGKVPKGWKVERLKSVAYINRDVLSEDTPADRVINYLDIGDVESNGMSSVPTEYTFENAPSRARRLVHDGTVILATVRTYLKAISYIESPSGNLIVSTGFATLDASKKVLSKYLYYLASSELIIQNVVRYSTGVSYPAIAPTVLGGLPVIYPSLEIQKQIVTSLDKNLALIDSGIEKIQTSIKLLLEYRTSLISHVVTGKVEV